jgi:hypothetical protein
MTEKKLKRRIFDKELLDECLSRDGAILIGDYNELRYGTIIKFRCKCGCESEKKFSNISDKGGAICKISCPQKEKPMIVYDNKLLSEVLTRDDATLKGIYDKLSIDTSINYICKCGIEHTKSFKSILKWGGALCKSCCNKIQNEKAKNTFIEKYGVSNPNQNKDIREKTKQTNITKYGTEHAFQSKTVKDKIKETNLERYGCEVPTQNKDVREKTKKTNLIKYGVENTSQNAEVRDKIAKTNLERYGSECSLNNREVQDKIKNTMMIRHGVEHNFQAGELRDKRKETFLAKYGVEHPAQNLEIQAKTERNSKKFKEYKMPSGIIKKVQGYEPFALDELVKSYTEEQLKTDRKDVPRVEYMIEEKKHFYFPDIYIPHENKIIEVKSTWTFNKKNDITMAKAKSCKEKGYCFELWIYDGKGGKQIITV